MQSLFIIDVNSILVPPGDVVASDRIVTAMHDVDPVAYRAGQFNGITLN